MGQTLLIGEVQGPGIDPAQSKAIWVVEPTLEVRLVAWPGMTAPLSNGQSVKLNSVGYGARPSTFYCADDDGRAGMLNDRGEFAFVGTWTSGAGVFISKPNVPALTSILLTPRSSKTSRSPP